MNGFSMIRLGVEIMKKKIIACLMCFSVGLVSVTNGLSVKAYEDGDYVLDEDGDYVLDEANNYESDDGSDDSEWITGEDIVNTGEDPDPVYIELGPGDLKMTPKKKTLRVGESFTLDLVAEDEDFWDEYDDDVWEASYDEIEVEYKSKKPYYVKVNSKGEVTAKHKTKGYVKIITTVYFQDGGMQKYTTQVYVKK
jgi:hypothetical protein